MLLFLLLIIPCVLALYCVYTKSTKSLLVMFTGLMVAVIYCAVRVIGFYSHRLIPDSFSSNYIYYLLRYTLIPVISIFVVYILLTRDSWELKFSMFFPLLGTFYAVFIPYKVIAFTQSVYSGYDIFLRPIVYIAMIGQVAFCLYYAYMCFTQKKIAFGILNIIILAVYLLVPAALDSMFALNEKTGIVVLAGLIYSLIPASYGAYKLIKSMIESAK